jgi:hypothetical protein
LRLKLDWGCANTSGGHCQKCQIDAAGLVLRLPNRAAALPVFETEPHSAERADPPTTSANSPVPYALPDALTDPGLARIVGAWPTLPKSIRRAVLALIGTTAP